MGSFIHDVVVRHIDMRKREKEAMLRLPNAGEQPSAPSQIARWIAGVVAVITGATTVYGLLADQQLAVRAFVGMIAAVLILLVVNHAITLQRRAGTVFDDGDRK